MMNNLYAYRLGQAAIQTKPGGDLIDRGWSLARALHEQGFDIVPRDRGPAGLNPAKTINEMCHFPPAAQSEDASRKRDE